MSNNSACEIITTAHIDTGHITETISETVPYYFNTMIYQDYPKSTAKRTIIGKVVPLYQGAP